MGKMLIIIGLVLFVLVFVFAAIAVTNSSPMTEEQVTKAIGDALEKEIEKNDTITNGMLYIDSGEQEYKESFAFGELEGEPVEVDQPFHLASVGKAFTATLIGVLIEEDKISLDDLLTTHLSEEVLDELFVFDGVDYKEEVTVRQLLNHTSGVADYFGDKAVGSIDMQQMVLDEPQRIFEPMDFVNFTREYQSAVGKPGDVYHYSDTGYVLLGLLIENVSGMEFHEYLHQEIFDPLNMRDSYLFYYSEPTNPKQAIADIWLNGVNIKDYSSLTVDWAGGGIISTVDDLAIFVRALNQGEIISGETLDLLYQFDYKFMKGIHYGNGFMSLHFKEFFPTLGFIPEMQGHMGILGTEMFYDRTKDMVYIASFGSTDASESSIKYMIKVLSFLERLEKEK